jgi:hypothetical protein
MAIETTHVRVRLISPDKEIFNPETGMTVSGKDVIKQMKLNNIWRNDREGRYAAVQYAGQTFKFKEGESVTVPASIAGALRANSAICVGSDKLNGPIIPFLDIADKFELTEATPAAKSPTCCPICGVDQKTFPALTRHLGQERKNHPELFEEKKTDWEGPQGGTMDEVEE